MKAVKSILRTGSLLELKEGQLWSRMISMLA